MEFYGIWYRKSSASWSNISPKKAKIPSNLRLRPGFSLAVITPFPGKVNIKKKKKIVSNWRMSALQYCVGFCHTGTWISHRYTCVPSHMNSRPPPPPHPPLLNCHRAPALNSCITQQIPTGCLCYMLMYGFQGYSLHPSHPIPLCVFSLCLPLHCCPASSSLVPSF